MTKTDYERSMAWTREHIGVKNVRAAVKLLTAATAGIYAVTAGMLFWQKDRRLVRLLAVPAAGFLAVSVFRKLLAARRPYEIYDFVPLLDKKTKGNSFPSRHVFSNMIIAMAVLSVNPLAGAFLILCGICLAVLRVLTGVHFPKDVAAGAGIAVILGMIGFYL